jgi:hypothetical protein
MESSLKIIYFQNDYELLFNDIPRSESGKREIKMTTNSNARIIDFLDNLVAWNTISEMEKRVLISQLEKVISIPISPFTCARIERDLRTLDKDKMVDSYWRMRNRIFARDYKLGISCMLLDVAIKNSENQDIIRFLHAFIFEAALSSDPDK